jgi:secreted trypsin-like serine protease
VQVLTKVSLSYVPNSICNVFYPKSKKSRFGLQDTQLCASDPVMDTCQGDSGGPLEIKLHAKSKLIPFVVGITSYGSICGAKIPGVYARVSSYIPWIESLVNETFDPLSKLVVVMFSEAIQYCVFF